MYKVILAFVLFAIYCKTGYAQDEILSSKIKDMRRLDDIVPTINNYYKDPATIQRLGSVQVARNIKHWRRWIWYMSSRVDENSRLVNIDQKLLEANGNQLTRSTHLAGDATIETQSTSGSWASLGPNNTTVGIGRVDRLAFHPTNANIVYAGSTAGGLWRTTNAGATWANLTPFISSPAISGIAIDPGNTNIIYILTGDGDSNIGGLVENFGYMRLSIGVLRSTDGGTTWHKTGNFPGVNFSSLVGYRLIMHPTQSNILYACTNQGLFVSINSGVSWGLSNGFGRFYDLVFRPGSGNVCYAVSRTTGNSARASFWKSNSSGLLNSWDSSNTINNQINNPTSRVEIAVAASNPNVVYLLCGGVAVSGIFKGLYRSADAGESFSLQSIFPNILGRANDGLDNEEQSNYDLAIAVSNTNSATVITGGIRCWRSFDSGFFGSFTFQGNHHEDVHDLGYNPVDNKLWMANDGGVYSSTNNGTTWTSHFFTMSISQFYRMDVRPDNFEEMIAGAQDNGIKRRPGVTNIFDHVSGADGFTVGYDATDNNTFYAIQNRDVARFTNNGATRNNITPNPPSDPNNPFAMCMAPHTSQGDALFIGSDSLWRTTDAGVTWNFSNINAGWFLRTCPSNGNRVYAAGGNSYQSATGILRRSDDGGVTWPGRWILSIKDSFPADYPKITSINVNPTNSAQVWVTFGGFTLNVKVYYSADAGLNWVNRSGTLPNLPVNTIALDSDNNAYVGTDNGVFFRRQGSADWVPFYNNLPYVPVTDLVISEAESVIRAATFGRGLWVSSLHTTCIPNIVLGGTINGQEFFEASNSVSSVSTLLASEGTKVQMRGGVQVHLQPGFSAAAGTQYRAVIGPCGSGGVAAFSVQSGVNVSAEGNEISMQKVANKRQTLLHVNPASKFPLNIILQNKTGGNVHLEFTRTDGTQLHRWPAEDMPQGKTQKSLSFPFAVAPGMYKLQVFHNDRLQHWQEVNIL
jgi:photosystem II stability/assembly factor-like uncharacterized protein